MRKLSTEKRAMILKALVEGNSVNATARLFGASKVTILRLLADAGTMCGRLHDDLVRGLQAERVQADEIWAFCHAKDKNLSRPSFGISPVSDRSGRGRPSTQTPS